jgi:hypothetical protein
VPPELTEDDSRAYGVVQAFSLLLSAGALYAAVRLTHQGGRVFLGLAQDPYDRDVWLGVGMGNCLALGGAVIAYMSGMGRGRGFLRAASGLLLLANLAVPAAWGVLWLLRRP